MKSSTTIILLAMTGAMFTVSSCGKSSSTTAAAVQYGTLKTSLLASETTTAYNLTAGTCSSDANTGFFTGTFTGESGSRLDLRIKGFSTTGQTYTCTQSGDNVDGDVGQKYNVCSVEFAVNDTATATANTYDMYRTADTIDPFTYSKVCKISTSYVPPKVTATVHCEDMIQTMLKGKTRNPVDPTVTGTVKADTTVSCNI
ncbi:MAG: hypothetical protein H7249_09040 [Chitinophagaceae bacterium]|nr:hypothetical protein [Oligoflexus sp.]